MNGSRIALDTNEAIAVLNNSSGTGQWIAAFPVVYLPVPVVGELIFGALNSQRASQNIKRVQTLVDRCRILEATSTTAQTYAKVRLQLKRAGRPIPENDVWIAALCVQHDLPLATSDEHFTRVDELKVVKR